MSDSSAQSSLSKAFKALSRFTTDAMTTKADYPWDDCIADQMKKYGDRETAEKVCGAIRARNKSQGNTVRNLLESKVHRAYTVLCDELFMRGYLSRDERLAVAGKIGDFLTQLGESLDMELAARPVSAYDVDWIATEKSQAVMVFKQANGEYRWVLFSSTAFEDRDREIVSLKALSDDVARADRDGDYGPLRIWHVPNADIGDCDFNMVYGRTLVESGTFRDPVVAKSVADHAAELEVSLGFTHPASEPDAEGVFHHIRRFERSLLPRGVASNRYTAVAVV